MRLCVLATALQPQARGELPWGRIGLERSHQGWTLTNLAIPLMIADLQADIDATQGIITRPMLVPPSSRRAEG
jgi:hypothetical protein